MPQSCVPTLSSLLLGACALQRQEPSKKTKMPQRSQMWPEVSIRNRDSVFPQAELLTKALCLCSSACRVLCQELDLLIRLLDITDTSLGMPYNILLVTQKVLKRGREQGERMEEVGDQGAMQRDV
ncbi:hypothetical protein NQZ68_005379 [Dissostichus eleginoides]|nr:hypothetical protein NQZ68_005379 [Dissostichus eleginoides]